MLDGLLISEALEVTHQDCVNIVLHALIMIVTTRPLRRQRSVDQFAFSLERGRPGEGESNNRQQTFETRNP
jgi:hypothetical protein